MLMKQTKGRDFIRMDDFTKSELIGMLDVAGNLKAKLKLEQKGSKILKNRVLTMIFMNPSLRTQNSFTIGMHQLGGFPNVASETRLPVLDGDDIPYQTERISDVARVLSGMSSAIAVRTPFVQLPYGKGLRMTEEFARWSDVPIINMADDMHHPCQGLADMMTLREKFGDSLNDRKIGVCWAYSPSTRKPVSSIQDFMRAASLLGANITLAHPKEIGIDPAVGEWLRQTAIENGGSFREVHNMDEACEDADIIYARNYTCLDLVPPVTDSFRDEEMKQLFAKYKSWILDVRRAEMAKPRAGFMHCLPCDRGYEIAEEVLDGPWGETCFQQSENRLHAQKGMLSCIIP